MPTFDAIMPVRREDTEGREIPFRAFVATMPNDPVAISNGCWRIQVADDYLHATDAVYGNPLPDRLVMRCCGLIYADGFMIPGGMSAMPAYKAQKGGELLLWAWDAVAELAWADAFPGAYTEAARRSVDQKAESNGEAVYHTLQQPGEPIFTIPIGEQGPTDVEARSALADQRDWGHEALGLELLHRRGLTGAGALVAILDTGVDYRHRDLSSNVRRDLSTDLTGSRNGYLDVNSHGTHCSGIVASDDDGGGMIGAAPDANVFAVKVLSDGGSGLSSWIANGIRYAADKGADVISLSLGGPSPDSPTRAAIDYAISKGAWVCAAAGNSGGPSVSYPGHYPTVLAVCATDRDNRRAGFSTINRENDISAPGVRIRSTLPGDRFGAMSGTSMACPYVAGGLALVRAELRKRGLPIPDQMEMIRLVRETADDLPPAGPDSGTGAGLLNVARLLERMIGSVPPPPPPPPPSVGGMAHLRLPANLGKLPLGIGLSFDRPDVDLTKKGPIQVEGSIS